MPTSAVSVDNISVFISYIDIEKTYSLPSFLRAQHFQSYHLIKSNMIVID